VGFDAGVATPSKTRWHKSGRFRALKWQVEERRPTPARRGETKFKGSLPLVGHGSSSSRCLLIGKHSNQKGGRKH